jgi:hypothetical protein
MGQYNQQIKSNGSIVRGSAFIRSRIISVHIVIRF